MSRVRIRTRHAGISLIALLLLLIGSLPAAADTTAQTLPFTQDWSNTALISANDDWSGVPGVIGYRGDAMVGATGVDPQTITADGSTTPVDVNVNQNPNTFATGGVSEFELANPVVALQGSGTARVPHLVLTLDTQGKDDITVFYNLRDVDGSADNAVQQVALQYRIGTTGSYTNLPAGFVTDATTGPSLATQVTPVSVLLPAEVDNQPLVQVRVITADAVGSDEWVGVDDISVTGGDVPPPDAAPFVSETSPENGAVDVPVGSNVSVTFSESVSVSGATFSIACETSGVHAFALSGGPTTYTLDPDSDFAGDETCTVTVDFAGVSDEDTNDPPDTMASDHVFTFSTIAPTRRIYEIQGAAHISPFDGDNTSGVPGVVTAVRSNGFNMQDATGDGNPATSDGIFVFTGSAPAVTAGEAVLVSGTVDEFRPGGASTGNLTTTELVNPVVTPGGTGATIAPTVVGNGGRLPPTMVIEDDASGNVETSGVFDPAQDGIDFYESLEGMLVQVNDAVAVGPTNGFGEIPVVANNGARASVRTSRGGVVIRPTDFNPERIILDDVIVPTPQVDVRDRFRSSIRAVVDYNFGNFKFLVTTTPTATDGGLRREVTDDPRDRELTVATFNVENLDPTDSPPKWAELADLIVDHLKAPDVIAVEEVQDNNGPTNDSTTDASVTWQLMIDTIDAVGGPPYEFRQIDPVDDQDGGEPGGNIRVGFLFRTDRPLEFVDRPGATPTTPNAVVTTPNGAVLQYSPGRIDPTNPAFNDSRKPLAGEFVFRGRRVFVIANHFNSKGGDDPLFGRFQPPVQHTQTQRIQQAEVVRDFVAAIQDADSRANVVVAGDLNDFEFSAPLETLEEAGLTPLIETLSQRERYTYVFDGNSQSLDHILINEELADRDFEYDIVHVNSEFHDQVSDHEPQVARLEPRGRTAS